MIKISATSTQLCMGIAAYLTLFCNYAFAQKFLSIVREDASPNLLFIGSVPVLLILLINTMLLPFSFHRILKPVLITTILTSGMFNFASFTYGVIFDETMFINVLQTDYAEASSYLNLSFFAIYSLTSVLPAALVLLTQIRVQPLRQELKEKGIVLGSTVCILGLMAFAFYKDYAFVGRNYKEITKQVVPIYPYRKIMQMAYRKFIHPIPAYTPVGMDAKQLPKATNAKNRLVVLVLGETQRSMNYSHYGYARDTNPYTKKLDVIPFENVTSFGTATAVSVPFMFSSPSGGYAGGGDEEYRDNAIDIIARAGVNVLWRDNDSGCKKTCKAADYEDMVIKYENDKRFCNEGSCHDGLFIDELKELIPTLPPKDNLVVFHIMGAHGPTYWQRYPAEFRKFTPDCPRSDVQNCSREELVNTYDNTILYSDYVLAGLIETLANTSGVWDSSLLFLSDHGESLGENGIYLHSFPRRFAPKEQVNIPFIFWQGNSVSIESTKIKSCMKNLAKSTTHDRVNIADTLLGLTDVKTDAYSALRDIFSPCRKSPNAASVDEERKHQ